MLKTWFFNQKRQKYVVEYKKKVAGVSNNVHLCSDNLNNLFALETNTY
jgi:alpha-amylase/alpha-mannosidase (GH57 family)